MNALMLVEALVLAALFLVVLTQWAIPFWRGTTTFPIFRAERRIERELERARQRRLEAELEERLKREQYAGSSSDGLADFGGIVPPQLGEPFERKGERKGEGDESVPR